MQPIKEELEVQHYQKLLGEMMERELNRTYEFNPEWIRQHEWKVVPVEDTGHFALEEIAAIVPALKKTGRDECIAIATEPMDPAPICYRLSISEEGLRAFNQECGLFRYVLTDESRIWAISCNEWYNLFAGNPEILEAMLGQPIDQARQEFLDFATLLAKTPEDPLLKIAQRYAAM